MRDFKLPNRRAMHGKIYSKYLVSFHTVQLSFRHFIINICLYYCISNNKTCSPPPCALLLMCPVYKIAIYGDSSYIVLLQKETKDILWGPTRLSIGSPLFFALCFFVQTNSGNFLSGAWVYEKISRTLEKCAESCVITRVGATSHNCIIIVQSMGIIIIIRYHINK